MVKQIYVNLPVKDLEKTKKFWTDLGFTFNPQFTDENAAALVLGENIFAMLLTHGFFAKFTKKEIADAAKTTEAINAVSVESREDVDRFLEKALAGGAAQTRPAEDYGWMYSRSFEDLDGHQWEILCADITKVPARPGEGDK